TSSISQSRRVELYSWRVGAGPLFSYLDVGEISRGTMRDVPAPIPANLPEWVCGEIDSCGHDIPAGGSLVLWPECDRLPYRKATTVRAKLFEALGRTYRYSLREGIRILVNGRLVDPIDPLMEWGATATTWGRATQYGDELTYEFKVPRAPSRTSVVRVRFTVLPVAKWARLPLETRRQLGVIGGAGVSIVRAGRELDNGWHLMGGKRRENYDDWWRCELRFEPELDEYFGVTHSKQGVTPHPALRDAMGADFERIARTLNARVRSEFVRLSTARAAPRGQPHEATDVPTVSEDAVARLARERERFLPPVGQRIQKFRIMHAPLVSARFFAVALEKGELIVTMNSEHPAFRAATNAASDTREMLETFLIAAARAEVAATSRRHAASSIEALADTSNEPLSHFFEAWSDVLAAYLNRRTR
ncbi:MAG TPA: hypothetical protein VIP11_16500, partial [Gemmatimonadaceae bacterium]